jgi:hypothetical protein
MNPIISADDERAYLNQIAQDTELFKSQYFVQQRQLSADEILGIVRFLTNWDLYFSRYVPVSQALASSGRGQMAARLGESHTHLAQQVGIFQQMYLDQGKQIDAITKIVQDAQAFHNQEMLQAVQNANSRMQDMNQQFLSLFEQQ